MSPAPKIRQPVHASVSEFGRYDGDIKDDGAEPIEQSDAPAPDLAAQQEQLKSADAAAQLFSATASVGEAVAACPLVTTFALEVAVVGPNDAGLPDVVVELWKDAEHVVRLKTDSAGKARFNGIDDGLAVQLSLPNDDSRAWTIVRSEALPDDQAKGNGHAVWSAAEALPATSSTTHTVVEGESAASLGARYGLLPDTIWNAAENATLKQTRKSMNILYPGDKVVIPPKTIGKVDAATKQRHTIRRSGATDSLEVRFLDGKDAPRAGVPYLMSIKTDDGTQVREGKTTAEGFVSQVLPAGTKTVELTLGTGETQELLLFHLGFIDPIDTVSGVQARLDNLGYICGPADGVLGPLTRRALKLFQADQGLTPSGEIDDATRARLVALYLS